MGCGGFVLTNFQPELSEIFNVGTDLVTYGNLDELKDITSYYLEHQKKRQEIAQNGFERVARDYNYPVRLEQLLQLAFSIS